MLDTELAGRVPSWSSIPTHLILEELRRRGEDDVNERPSCKSAQQADYDIPIHVVALVIILVLSTAGCGFPLISQRASKRTCTHKIVFFSQHFGTGVLIATAFVHLIPTAFLSLTNSCLPWFFSEGYSPLAGVIAMTSVLIVVGIEMFLRTRGVVHSHSHGPEEWTREESPDHGLGEIALGAGSRRRTLSEGDGMSPDAFCAGSESAALIPPSGPWTDEPISERPRDANGNITASTKENKAEAANDAYVRRESQDSDISLDEINGTAGLNGHAATQTYLHKLTAEEEAAKKTLQCLLLEAGILFHSVFIGMAVSVATGPPFIVLLVAICFHQIFEGMALGSRIAAIKFPARSPKPWLMVLAYGLTTPIGQAIGLGVHATYDPQSATGLLMVGIMNAISAGLLLFAGLVQLLAEDFLSDMSYGTLQGKKRVQAYISVILGAILMALVGAWA